MEVSLRCFQVIHLVLVDARALHHDAPRDVDVVAAERCYQQPSDTDIQASINGVASTARSVARRRRSISMLIG